MKKGFERDGQNKLYSARRIEQIAMEYLNGVNIDDIASQVFFDLDGIAVEEVWDQSGSTRDGYVDPGDMAWEMFEEACAYVLFSETDKPEEHSHHCLGLFPWYLGNEWLLRKRFFRYILSGSLMPSFPCLCNDSSNLSVEILFKKKEPRLLLWKGSVYMLSEG